MGFLPNYRHQILEHGASPGNQDIFAFAQRVLTSQAEPAFLESLALCDGYEGCRPRLRRKQVVAGFIQLALLHVIPDRQQASSLVNERFETHLPRQSLTK